MRKAIQTVILVAALLVGSIAQGQTMKQLTEQEKADTSANWVYTFKYGDFNVASTNTAETNTVNILAKQGFRVVAMTLPTAFDTGSSALWTTSVGVVVGDGSDADLFLTSTELASDSTEVFLKYGRSGFQTLSLNTAIITNEAKSAAITNIYTAVTNATISQTEGTKVYTSDDTIDFIFTPSNEEMLSSNTAGEVRFYIEIWDATRR